MTNGVHPPSAITGDTFTQPSFGAGGLVQLAIPWLATPPSYGDIPGYWSWARDALLSGTVHREDMWAGAVARTATKFAAHGFTIKDSTDSSQKVNASQRLLKGADGGDGWVSFAEKLMQDFLTCDNGIFVRIRRADDQAITVKAAQTIGPYGAAKQTFDQAQVFTSSPGAKITGLYHLDSLRCQRTGNLTYPVRYQPVMGAPQLLRWDQVLCFADMPSPRAELYGVGLSAASRAYKTIVLVAALRQLVFEFVSGGGANQLVLVGGINDKTLTNLVNAGLSDAQAKGFIYYLGTVLGAIPADVPLTVNTIPLKQLPQGFDPKQLLDDAYLIYANAIGVPVQDIQPLSGQGMGTGKQTEILQDASRGVGIAALLKWWEQTVSDRVLPATTELSFDDEHDLRDQKARAEVRSVRAQERATRITSGEISAPMARQIAADDGDLAQELLAADATPGGQITDSEKPQANDQASPAAAVLMQGAPTGAPQQTQDMQTKAAWDGIEALIPRDDDDLLDRELRAARALAGWAQGD